MRQPCAPCRAAVAVPETFNIGVSLFLFIDHSVRCPINIYIMKNSVAVYAVVAFVAAVLNNTSYKY
jgi:hypothetical protein